MKDIQSLLIASKSLYCSWFRSRNILIGIFSILIASSFAFGPEASSSDGIDAENAAKKPTFETAKDFEWHVKPTELKWSLCCSDSMVISTFTLKENDKFVVSYSYPEEFARDVHQFRTVGFDENGKRIPFASLQAGSTGTIAMQCDFLDPKIFEPSKLRYLGIEKLSKANLKNITSKEAAAALKLKGGYPLPYPEIGKPYSFDIVGIDGSKISSESFLGKVLLVDFWATWCTPCMAKMPELKKIYDESKSKGFEIIGINNDEDLEKAKKAIAANALNWKQAAAPMDAEDRKLWEKTSGLTSLPRLFVIDRKGILRADCRPGQLKEEIHKVLADK